MIKRIRLLWAAAILVAGLFLQSNASAADLTSPPATQSKSGAAAIRQYPFRGKLAQIDKIKREIALGGRQKVRRLQLTDQTKILRAGKPAKLEEAAVGENVSGLASRVGGKEEILTLHLGVKPAVSARGKKRQAAE